MTLLTTSRPPLADIRLCGLQVTFDCADPPFLGHFWSEVTGYRVAVWEPDHLRLDGVGLGVDHLVFREVATWKSDVNRVRLELTSSEPGVEIERIVGLGAAVVDQAVTPDGIRAVLRDPEGNEFSVTGPAR